MSDDDVPVSALLGAAYEAVVHGQSLAAREAIELVKDLGFEKNGTAKPFRFAYQRTEATDGGPQVRTVHATVPLLSLINPPSISIDSAKINMSLHLISQDIKTAPADDPAASGGTTVDKTTPKLKGRIVHQRDKNAVLTIESTLKQRDLLGSSRLSQLLDAAVSDRDSVWYQVLDRAEPFREAATALIDTVAQDGSRGKGVGVREWLQQLWELKEAVTDAVSAFRDGLPEKIPPLHQRWNTQCQKLTWIDRHTEPETMARLRRAFIAAAGAVWNALLPGVLVGEFGPPTVEQLRDRFKNARAALAAAVPSLTDLLGKLEQLEGTVAQGCIAHQYKQPEAVAGTLQRYNTTAAEIRMMWTSSAPWSDSRAKQDELDTAAKAVWDALVPRTVPVDFRVANELETECNLQLYWLRQNSKDIARNVLIGAVDYAQSALLTARRAWEAEQQLTEPQVHEVVQLLHDFNTEIDKARPIVRSRRPGLMNPTVIAWDKRAGKLWGRLIDTESHPVTYLRTSK
ncbi:DUF2589 domain-containing protein [Streptomyces sp. AD681]|uniref:DUF2589 domain-containing protein n=1 Tax=Streptomyces sp. AD681 TaxID=3019069 RepID=UPI0022F1BAE2|nr:DUF2589 domain-containing protein [Streptomyces sp. AD681]MDA5142824.1 DUF2589 domain-containing protein [Streptomyces sp. AD681]